jgi:ribonucleoside-triphosphate reductase
MELKPVSTTMVTFNDREVKVEPVESHKYLFTTRTCPNCRAAKKMLEGVDLEIIDAERNPELVKQYGIMHAPTLVVVSGEHQEKYVNASSIQKYVDARL